MMTSQVVRALERDFVRMYRLHESREGAIVFLAIHGVLGSDGYESMVDQIAAIEKELGIYDLSQLTREKFWIAKRIRAKCHLAADSSTRTIFEFSKINV